MNRLLVPLIIVLLVLLAGVGIAIYFIPALTPVSSDVVVLTDKTEYSPGESLKIRIENNKEEKICFSSCYPYYIQRKDGIWKSYAYEKCDKKDTVENCVDPKEIKAFELTVPQLKKGIHRLLLSACVQCNIQQDFRGQESLFSNRFVVK